MNTVTTRGGSLRWDDVTLIYSTTENGARTRTSVVSLSRGFGACFAQLRVARYPGDIIAGTAKVHTADLSVERAYRIMRAICRQTGMEQHHSSTKDKL